MNLTPKDQILLLAGLQDDGSKRARIWALPELAARRARLTEAGLIDGDHLTDPAGVQAAGRIRHITLDDLIAEHLPAEV